jgi:serine/threonine protein kinase
MAEVYRARDLRLRREVAVKVLPATLAADPEYVKRFKNEATQVAALNHPHIVPVYYFDADRGLLFLVMPVLRESLRDRMDREGTLNPTEAVDLAAQIASGLHAAHQLGLVHRDVKPENILLDAEGQALLTDFGIARQVTFTRKEGVAQTLAATGLPVGTPEYMAPEQLRGSNVDQRADIYGLGAVLYELLTGVVPHDAASPYEVAALVLTEETLPPAQRNPAIWPQLDSVVMRSLAKDPDERYQYADSFAAALRQAFTDQASAPTIGSSHTLGVSQRIMRRSTHPSTMSTGTSAVDAPTKPNLPTWDVRRTGGPDLLAGGERDRPSTLHSRWWMGLMAAGALLVTCACGLGAVHALAGFGAGANSGNTPSSAVHTATPAGTSYGGGLATQTPGDGTPGVIGHVTPSPSVSPTLPPSATPSPTQPPTPLLQFSSPIAVDQPSFNGHCTGTQTISNQSSTQTVGWNWQLPKIKGFSFYLRGSFNAMSWPSDTAGISPGGQDILYVVASSCDSKTYHITAYDTLGNSYQFTMRVGEGG